MADRWTAPNRNAYKTGLRGNALFHTGRGGNESCFALIAVTCVNLLEPQTELKVPATENCTAHGEMAGTRYRDKH